MRPPVPTIPPRPMMPMQNPYNPYANYDPRLATAMFSGQLNPGDAMAMLNRGGNSSGIMPLPHIMELGGSTGVAPSMPANNGTAYREWLMNNRTSNTPPQRTPPQFDPTGYGRGAGRESFQDRINVQRRIAAGQTAAQQAAAARTAAMSRQAMSGGTGTSGDGTGIGRVGINGDATGMGNNAVARNRSTFQSRVNDMRNR